MKNHCPSGKIEHPTRIHAKVRAIYDFRRHGHHLYPYQCQICGRWHLTRKPQFEELIEMNLKTR